MTRIEFDTSEVDALATDLSKAPGRIQRKAPGVFARGAFETKKNLQRMAKGHSHLPSLDRHVGYDRTGLLEYEIGFNKAGQGNLANFAVYGSVNNAPVMGTPTDALRLELPNIMRHLGDEGEAAVFGGAK